MPKTPPLPGLPQPKDPSEPCYTQAQWDVITNELTGARNVILETQDRLEIFISRWTQQVNENEVKDLEIRALKRQIAAMAPPEVQEQPQGPVASAETIEMPPAPQEVH